MNADQVRAQLAADDAAEDEAMARLRAARRAEELVDVLAYLERKRDNALTMAANSHEFADLARDRARQLGIVIDELRAGLHIGEAEVAEARRMTRQLEGA